MYCRVILLFIFYCSVSYIEGMYYLEGLFNIQITVIINLLQAVFRYVHETPPTR
jgi:hypothetical protein